MDAHKHLASDREDEQPMATCVHCDAVCSGDYTEYGWPVCLSCYYRNDEVVQGVEDEAEYDLWKEA